MWAFWNRKIEFWGCSSSVGAWHRRDKVGRVNRKFWGCSRVGRGKLLCESDGSVKMARFRKSFGVVAQLVEHLLCKQRVVSSSLISSTTFRVCDAMGGRPPIVVCQNSVPRQNRDSDGDGQRIKMLRITQKFAKRG